MKRLIIPALAATMAIAMSAQTNQVSITVTSSWNKVYAWIWKCPKRYSERFIPLTKVDNNNWTLTLDMDETAYKKAGILFVDTDSWNGDLQKTSDLRLSSGCYTIPKTQKQGQLVKRPNGLVCRELIFDCQKGKCR